MSNPPSPNPKNAENLFFEHFVTLATAPDGIARLRELILQLAVQGKLGTQDERDEPASVLLERIRKEKERLIKEEKIKKEKPLQPVRDSDVGFQIPDIWVLTRLGEIAQYNAEKKTSANEISEDAWVLDLEDIEKDTSRILQKMRFKDRQSLSTKSRFRKGDVLYGKLRPYLNKVVVADEDGYCTTEIVPIRPYAKIFPKYLMYAIKTPDFLSYVNSKTYGIKMPRLGTVDALNTIIPLPPLAEQHRIVAKVDRLMAICDELEARQQQERAGCLKLSTASLAGLQNAESTEEFERQWALVCDAFDLILDCPENVAVLRQTILQLAVQGRLVRQDQEDEPAKKLVERIKKEKGRLVKEGKIKREKPLDKIKAVPYKVPDGWQLCQLGEISEIIMGNSPPGDTYNIYGDGVPLINGPTEFSKNPLGKTIVSQYTTQPTKFCKENDLLICVRGATTGRTNIAGFDACVGRGVAVIRSLSIQSYLNLFTLTKAQQILNMGTGSTFPSISQNDLLTIPVPLPPLAEQHRIVAKVDALMALCDALEARLKERAGVQERFAVAVIGEFS